MSDRVRIGLNDPAFRPRLRPVPAAASQPRGPVRQPFGPRVLAPRQGAPAQLTMEPIVSPKSAVRKNLVTVQPQGPALVPKTSPAKWPAKQVDSFRLIQPQPFAKPAHPKLQQSHVLHRQVVRNPAAPQLPITQKPPANNNAVAPKRSRLTKLQLALVGMAGFIFLTGLFVSLLTLKTNQSAKVQVAALAQHAQQSDGSAAPNAPPVETKPTTTTMASYQVAPDLPRQIIIPKLYVYARVRSMAVNAKNELQAPGNIYDAGWYNASAKPGDSPGNGAMVIDGHVHGPTLPGVFANLKKLIAGDVIRVVRGDGKTYTYTVVKTQNYEAANLDIGLALASATPGKAALNLITCGGPYDKATGEYAQRTIVFAVQS